MSLLRIRRAELPAWQDKLRALEHLASYPIGNDRFQIDHGSDYFRFFERLGELHYYAVVEGGELRSVGAGMIREVPFRQGQEPRRCWYAGDLKVHPEHRGKRIPISMATRLFLPKYLRCRRGYAISMNPGDGSPNRVVTLSQKFKWASVKLSASIDLYSLDEGAMRAAAPLLVEHRGPLSYLSLRGIKDIILESTGQPMPLLHVQFGGCAEPGLPAPQAGHTHMFCVPRGDALSQALAGAGFEPAAAASVLSHGMDSDWRFILTSDI